MGYQIGWCYSTGLLWGSTRVGNFDDQRYSGKTGSAGQDALWYRPARSHARTPDGDIGPRYWLFETRVR